MSIQNGPNSCERYNKASAIILLSVLLYQILVYYKCKTNKVKPRAIKYMLRPDDYNNRVIILVHSIQL